MTTIDQTEVAAFEALAAHWWDEDGPHGPLHKMNPTRLEFVRDQICERFDRDPEKPKPLAGLTVLDVGCGGGLVSEPLCRLGATVTGIDAGEKNIGAARTHAEAVGLQIDYQATTAEALAQNGARFDAVVALEIIEHVQNPKQFVDAIAACVGPDGTLVLSTLNRTAKSFALGIVAAEYVLRWVPRGTHTWSKFFTPAEVIRLLFQADMCPWQIRGLHYNPVQKGWSIGRDVSVNYMLSARK